MAPELKQFGDLVQKPWYDETDEETFRPWNGPLPASSSEGMLLVRATIELADGSKFPGFVTPALDEDDLGVQQPQIFVGGRHFGFWGGILGLPAEERQAFYASLGKPPRDVFPLRFAVAPNLAVGFANGEVTGFYRTDGDNVAVEL